MGSRHFGYKIRFFTSFARKAEAIFTQAKQIVYICIDNALFLLPMTFPSSSKPPVALVLSSGGARGYAHIGAIKALTERGYPIASVAGTSMGSLIGGLYCMGKLDEATEWFYTLTRQDILQLIDLSVGKNYVVKGDKVMKKLKQMVPDVKIETLPIPFRAVAADIVTQREVVFSKGSTYRAIRSSIAMPSIFKPIQVAHHILIDGGIVNPLPLNRVVRTEDDLLVSINVSAPASMEIEEARQQLRKKEREESRWLSLQRLMQSLTPNNVASNYMTLISSVIDLQIQRNTVLTQKLTPPDIAVNIPMNRFGVFEFDRAEHIAQIGYKETLKQIDLFEKKQTVGL